MFLLSVYYNPLAQKSSLGKRAFFEVHDARATGMAKVLRMEWYLDGVDGVDRTTLLPNESVHYEGLLSHFMVCLV